MTWSCIGCPECKGSKKKTKKKPALVGPFYCFPPNPETESLTRQRRTDAALMTEIMLLLNKPPALIPHFSERESTRSVIFSESYLQWRKCSSWSWASFHAQDFYGWSGRTFETRLKRLPSTQLVMEGCSSAWVCVCLCVCVCTHTRYRSVLQPRPSSTTLLSALFSPDEGRSVRPYCVENTFSKKKIWFGDSEPPTRPLPNLSS